MTDVELARAAYAAYSASLGNQDSRGEPLPAWGDLSRAVRIAWQAVACHVGLIYEAGGITADLPDVRRWVGWVPEEW